MNTITTLDLTPHFALVGDQPFKDSRAMMPFRVAIPVAQEQLLQPLSLFTLRCSQPNHRVGEDG
ncbi:heme anaerobic degradation radical SAM methyltransferase ChuW/HutW, partial [Escherichia coli]